MCSSDLRSPRSFCLGINLSRKPINSLILTYIGLRSNVWSIIKLLPTRCTCNFSKFTKTRQRTRRTQTMPIHFLAPRSEFYEFRRKITATQARRNRKISWGWGKPTGAKGAEIETPKASSGWVWGVVSPPHLTRESGSVVSWRKTIWCILMLSGGNWLQRFSFVTFVA